MGLEILGGVIEPGESKMTLLLTIISLGQYHKPRLFGDENGEGKSTPESRILGGDGRGSSYGVTSDTGVWPCSELSSSRTLA